MSYSLVGIFKKKKKKYNDHLRSVDGKGDTVSTTPYDIKINKGEDFGYFSF